MPEALRHRIVELDAAVESRFAQHRGEVGGRSVDDNEIKRILRSSDDVAERREAWEASKTIGAAVAEDVRELARLRNEAARSLGYRDWFALAVATSEMDETRLFETLDECDRLTADAFASWKAATDAALAERFGCAVGGASALALRGPVLPGGPGGRRGRPGGVFDGKDVVALARETFAGIGVDTGPILDRSDLFAREGKSQHAFCIDIDREGDVRVLANVEPDRFWADTMLHELGHGAYDIGFDPSLPWLLRSCHLTVTEGIAILMGRLALETEWLTEVAGLAPAEAKALDGRLRAAQAAELLVFTRWVLVMTNFERALYADPEQDLSQTVVESRLALPAPHASGGAGRAGLGVEAPRRVRAGLLPHVPLREPRRVPAPGDARRGRGRARRATRGRVAARRARVPSRPVRPLGPAARAGDRRAAHGGARRALHRARTRRLISTIPA